MADEKRVGHALKGLDNAVTLTLAELRAAGLDEDTAADRVEDRVDAVLAREEDEQPDDRDDREPDVLDYYS